MMRFGWLVPALCGLAVSVYAAQPQQDLEGFGEVEEIRQKIHKEIDRLEPLLEQLEGLRSGYLDPDKFSQLEDERKKVRAEGTLGIKSLDTLLQEFRRSRKEYQFRQGTMIIAKFLSGKNEQEVGRDLRNVLELDHFPSFVKDFRVRLEHAMNRERTMYLQARASRSRRRMIILGAASTIILLVLLGVLIHFALKRQTSPQTVTAIPVRIDPSTGEPIPIHGSATPTPSLAQTTPQPALSGPPTPGIRTEPLTLGAGDELAGQFKILKEAGSDAIGTVFEGQEKASQKPLLIKRLREELHQSEKDIERFLEYAREVSQIKHENIVEIYSVFIEAERVYLALENVSAKPLSGFLEAGSRINLRSVKRVLRQVGAALDFAHGRKVIHGDLTPNHIFVNGEGIVKISDFAIGNEVRRIAAKAAWTEPIGSPAYMAPEQELGSNFKESDLYSLGVILYEMSTGNLPFEGPNFLAQKRELRYRPPSRFAPDIPKELDAVIQKALQPEPQYRYHSATEFIAALEGVPAPRHPTKPSPSH